MNDWVFYTILFGVVSWFSGWTAVFEFLNGSQAWGAAYLATSVATCVVACMTWKFHWQEKKELE